ncbi:MAG TPA: cytochrome c oxidase accessory protein CcoG, partial [Phaeodactylibacter sp.]|nr:cytochrome c oxidase accessory protein CcoG [Phaeodactylibacter sp.]
TTEAFPVEFRLENINGKIKIVGDPPTAIKDEKTEGALFIEIPPEKLKNRKTKLHIGVYSNGKKIDEAKTTFFSPQ